MTRITPAGRHLTAPSPIVFTGLAIALAAFARGRRALRARRDRK